MVKSTFETSRTDKSEANFRTDIPVTFEVFTASYDTKSEFTFNSSQIETTSEVHSYPN